MIRGKTFLKVRYLLVNYPHLRGDDMKLLANIWYFECIHLGGKKYLDYSYRIFFKNFIGGKFTLQSEVLRTRQKVCEVRPELKVISEHKQNNSIKSRIEKILTKNKESRDNDNKLLVEIWSEDINSRNINDRNINVKQFLKLLADWKLSRFDTIRRLRQKLQEEKPELRGKKYRFRQSYQWDVAEKIKEKFEGEYV